MGSDDEPNQPHKYYEDSGTRFYCTYNSQKFYLACHKYYPKDILNESSVLLIVHNNYRDSGMNFQIENYGNKIRLSYIDNVFGMKNWNLYIDNGNPVFNSCFSSYLELEPCDKDIFLIKDIDSKSYLFMDLSRPRDNNQYGKSFYVGLCKNRNQATRFRRIDK